MLPPERTVVRPLGCHRPRIPDRIVFDELSARLALGRQGRQVAARVLSFARWRHPPAAHGRVLLRHDDARPARRMDQRRCLRVAPPPRAGGIRPGHRPRPAPPCGRRVHCQGTVRRRERGPQPVDPVDRGRSGLKRSVLVDGSGIPIGWVLAGARRNDSRSRPCLRRTSVRVAHGSLDTMSRHAPGGRDARGSGGPGR